MRAHLTVITTVALSGLFIAGCSRTSSAISTHDAEAANSADATARKGKKSKTKTRKGRSKAPSGAPDLSDGEDVLEEALAYNSDEYAGPQRTFRPGHVTPRKLPASAITREKTGFRVQLPNGAPIGTPAVHEGVVIASGGFHSKEMYAFNAQSGDLAWAISLDDDGPSAPACDDRVCVFNTESCTVFAVEAESGEMLWSWWLGDPLTSAPTIADGRVFTSYPAQMSGAGQLYGANGGPNGSLGNAANVQHINPPPQPRANPGGSSGKQRPPGQTHALAAFDLETGELLWTKWIDSDVMSAPVAIGDAVFATTFAGTVYKFDQKTGKVLAARRARATSAPVIVGSDVYYTKRTDDAKAGTAHESIARSNAVHRGRDYTVASRKAVYLDQQVQQRSTMSAQGAKLDASNGFGGGAPTSANPSAALGNIGQGNVSTMQAFQGSRIVHSGGFNVNSMGDEIVGTDAETGKARWKHKLDGDMAKMGGFLATAPAAAGESVFIGTLDGHILELDRASGKVRANHAVGAPIRSQPVVEDGWIYVGTDDGRLVAIDTGDTSLTGWSQWGGDAARTGVLR